MQAAPLGVMIEADGEEGAGIELETEMDVFVVEVGILDVAAVVVEEAFFVHSFHEEPVGEEGEGDKIVALEADAGKRAGVVGPSGYFRWWRRGRCSGFDWGTIRP